MYKPSIIEASPCAIRCAASPLINLAQIEDKIALQPPGIDLQQPRGFLRVLRLDVEGEPGGDDFAVELLLASKLAAMIALICSRGDRACRDAVAGAGAEFAEGYAASRQAGNGPWSRNSDAPARKTLRRGSAIWLTVTSSEPACPDFGDGGADERPLAHRCNTRSCHVRLLS